MRACVRAGPRSAAARLHPRRGRPATLRLSVGPWTDPLPARGLSLPLGQAGKGALRPLLQWEQGWEKGPPFQPAELTVFPRLSFGLCKMGQNEQLQGSNGSAAGNVLWKPGSSGEAWAGIVARAWSQALPGAGCFFPWGGLGREEGGNLSLVLLAGRDGPNPPG